MQSERLFGIDFVSEASIEDVVDHLFVEAARASERFRFVVTPNVDYLVGYAKSPRELAVAQRAVVALPDGMPVVWASRLLRRPLRSRLAGSDLFAELWERCGEREVGVVALVASDVVRERLLDANPVSRIVVAPMIDVDDTAQMDDLVDTIVAEIIESRPAFLILGLSMAKINRLAELLSERELPTDVAPPITLLLGASAEFYVGARRRAPEWMQRSGLEWAHRLLGDPKRMARRYLIDDMMFVPLVFREWRTSRRARTSPSISLVPSDRDDADTRDDVDTDAGRRTPIAYLATHLPAISHTFIVDEIDQLERAGHTINTISINTPREVDLLDHDCQRWLHRTRYLKSTPPARAVGVFARTILQHPSAALMPLRRGAFGGKELLWSYLHLVEAALVVDHMRKKGCRHLHAHFGQTPATIAWFAAELGNLGSDGPRWTWSVTVHGWHEFVNEDAAQLRRKAHSASLVVCISDFTRAQMMRIASETDWHKLRVVRCGVNFERFTASRHAATGTTGDRRVIVVARLSPEKGHVVLLEAVALLRDRGLDLDLDVVGPDVDGFGAFLRRRSDELGIGERVTMHGPKTPDEIAELLSRADAFCLPSFAEGLPVVIMEAMAKGVPVVTTFISGIPELAVDGTTAAVVPAGSSTHLADALERVLIDRDHREHLVSNAAAAVRERHDVERNAMELSHLLTAVVSTGRADDV